MDFGQLGDSFGSLGDSFSGAADAYAANAVRFDGANDYLNITTGLTGAPTTKVGTINIWVRLFADSALQLIWRNGTGGLYTQINSDNTIGIRVDNIINFNTTATITADGNWHHILCSFDGAATTVHTYIDGSSESHSAADVSANWDVNANYAIGAVHTGASKINAELADVYINPSEFIDISNAANRALFRDGDGKPVDLGSDGSTPTGNAPIMFFSGDTDSWHTNKGTGGGFTENGALADGSSSPSD